MVRDGCDVIGVAGRDKPRKIDERASGVFDVYDRVSESRAIDSEGSTTAAEGLVPVNEASDICDESSEVPRGSHRKRLPSSLGGKPLDMLLDHGDL